MTTDVRQLDDAVVEELEGSFRGEIVRPSDPTYDEKRAIWNGSIDRKPALIARCAGVADVMAAIPFARETGLLVAVRGGGHSFPGLSTCDGGLVIDLGPMKGVRVDPDKRTVRVQPGVVIGELDRETQAFGLAVTGGIVTHTGVAGLTLGGGIGFLHRKLGLSIDNLLSVDVVTASGDFLKASEDENADLFWGVRGGGGNFGIVTEFTFKLSALGPQIVGGPIFWPLEEAPKVLRFYRDWLADCPDDVMTIGIQRRAPDIPIVPRDLVGKHVVGIVAFHSGSVEEGEKVLRPLKEFASPVLDLCVPKPYVVHQQTFDPGFPHYCSYYVRSCDVAALDDDVVDVVVKHGLRIKSPMSSIALWQMGGAVSRVSDDETAFNGRDAGFTFNINGNTPTADGFEEEREWARSYWSALEQYHTSVYTNFLMEEGEQRVREAYGPAKYDRLKALKRKYDPDNFFRLNQNIRPD